MKPNIISANKYYNGLKNLSTDVKSGDYNAIKHSAKLMAQMVGRSGCVFIPIPSHQGFATYTKELAELIAKYTNGICVDILSGDKRDTFYNLKKQNKNRNVNFGFTINDNIKDIIGKRVYLVDNVIATGETYKQASNILKKILGYKPKLLTISNDVSQNKVNNINMKQNIGYIKENQIINIIKNAIKKALLN